MDTTWAFRQAYVCFSNRTRICSPVHDRYDKARQIKEAQDEYCAKAKRGDWYELGAYPEDFQWEALVDVLRGRVKVHTHCYETVDLDDLVRVRIRQLRFVRRLVGSIKRVRSRMSSSSPSRPSTMHTRRTSSQTHSSLPTVSLSLGRCDCPALLCLQLSFHQATLPPQRSSPHTVGTNARRTAAPSSRPVSSQRTTCRSS